MRALRATVIASLGLGLALVVSACASTSPLGDPQEGNAFLRIVGDGSQVQIGDGAPHTLKVRYEDRDGNPLGGEIAFHIVGIADGANLSADHLSTDANGEAQVQLTGPTDVAADLEFEVEAEAVYARPASWNVLVYSGSVGTLKIAGTYDVDSSFDLIDGMPGRIGNVLQDLESMTEIDENDLHYGVITWALDELDQSLEVGGFVKSVVDGMRPELDAAAYAMLQQYAPTWLIGLQTTIDRITDFAREFRASSTLTIIDNGDGTYKATHTMTAVEFNGAPVAFTSLGLPVVVATDIPVTVVGRTVTIGMHHLGMSYGDLLVFAFNAYAVPELADILDVPSARDLNDLLQGIIDCRAVSEWVVNSDGGGIGTDVVEAACRAGVRELATYLEDQLRGVGPQAGGFDLVGTATARVGHDGQSVEKLQGEWTGRLSVAGVTSTLTAPNHTFIATPTAVTP
jgi:hypothetical protein